MNFLNLKAVLSLNGSGFALGLKRAESQSKQFAKEIKGEFARAFGTAAIVAYSAKIVNLADEIVDLSDRLGISTKSLQEWAYAAKKSGSDIQAVTRFLEQLAVAREKALGGDANTLEAFSKLGVSQSDLESMSVDQIGRKISGTVKDGNVSDLIAPLRQVGGRSAGELIPAMKGDIEALSKAANDAGKVMSDETIQGLKDAKTELQNLADTLQGPVAIAITYAAKLIRNAVDVFRIGAGGIGAFLGTLFGGGSIKDAGAAAMGVFDEIEKEREEMEKRSRETIANRNAAAVANGSADLDKFGNPWGEMRTHDMTPLKAIAEKTAQSSINIPGLTGWQSAGAAVRFNPDRGLLRDIANATKETAQNTKPTNTRPAAIQDLGGGFS